jgi:hypothetical protein
LATSAIFSEKERKKLREGRKERNEEGSVPAIMDNSDFGASISGGAVHIPKHGVF